MVLKFGGVSVSSLINWRNILKLIQMHVSQGSRPFVVCSAVAGVTDQLTEICRLIETGSKIDNALNQFRDTHLNLTRQLNIDISEEVEKRVGLLKQLAEQAAISGVTPQIKAQILAQGELLSTSIGTIWLTQNGLKTQRLDAREMLVSSGNAQGPQAWLSAKCDHSPDSALQSRLHNIEATVFLTQGFIARNQDGETVLLGRGGSDTSAACFARKLSAPLQSDNQEHRCGNYRKAWLMKSTNTLIFADKCRFSR